MHLCLARQSYKTSVVENAPKTTIVTKISATDADESSHRHSILF